MSYQTAFLKGCILYTLISECTWLPCGCIPFSQIPQPFLFNVPVVNRIRDFARLLLHYIPLSFLQTINNSQEPSNQFSAADVQVYSLAEKFYTIPRRERKQGWNS